MSEPIPESVPTSSDPRSKRPTKRRALTPGSQQANQIDALFANPDKEIILPPSSSALKASMGPPPEIVPNVQGSSAGAGSGEFHVYKASRRREYERLRAMDDEVREEKEKEDFEREREERKKKEEAKTSKNKARRDKAKERKKNKGKEGDKVQGPATSAPKAVLKPNPRLNDTDKGKDEEEEQTNGQHEEIGLVIHDDD